VALSFIGGGNQGTRRKPLTNYHIMLYRVHLTIVSVQMQPLTDWQEVKITNKTNSKYRWSVEVIIMCVIMLSKYYFKRPLSKSSRNTPKNVGGVVENIA